jgi:hypothetical protein
MIDRQHGKFLVECDSCDAVLDTGTDDVGAARRRIEHEGWGVEFVGGRSVDILHACPTCGAEL